MVVEFMLKGSKTKIDTDAIISLLKAGNDIENEYIIGVIQGLVAKCEALEPLNISILDLLSIKDKQAKEIKCLEAELKQLKEENEKAKSNTHGINWELFATGEIAVQCETEADTEAFLEKAIKMGCRCYHRKLIWNDYKSETCFSNEYISPIGTFIVYGNKSYYEDKGIKVVKWKPDEAEVLYDVAEDVQVKSAERIKKLVSKIKEQKEITEFYKNQCEELRKTCNKLREENASIKNDKSELILAIKNTRDDIKMTADYLDSIVSAFNDNNEFDWDRFKTANIAVCCRTLEEAIDFIKSAKDHVKIWYNGDKIDYNVTLWDTYKKKICYYFSKRAKGLLVTSSEISKRENREILEWSDYMVKHDE